jgi:hypothetical protein
MKHDVQVAYSDSHLSKHILTCSRYFYQVGTSERTAVFIRTGDRLLPFPARSPPCIDQQNQVPCEPYQPVNLDGGCNGSRVYGDSLLMAG